MYEQEKVRGVFEDQEVLEWRGGGGSAGAELMFNEQQL